jgi:N-acetyl-anhydromuramyl-L-alanine amidase AmpD
MARKSTRRSKRKAPPAATTRTRIVWGSLLLAMTGVGGLLGLLQGGPSPRLDGLSLPPMVAAAGPSNIEAIFSTRQPMADQRWQAIVIHHSGSGFGTAASIEAQHRAMNLEGLGYHFVVGNGSGMGNGEIRAGYRWLDQLPGAHVAGAQGDWYNRNAIGICLVGDGRKRSFNGDQMQRTVQLVSALCDRLGIPPSQVYLHSELAPTDDPGRFFPEAAFREQLARLK